MGVHLDRQMLAGVRALGEEIAALETILDLEKTFHNAAVLQGRRRERDRLVDGLRGRIRIVHAFEGLLQ